MIQTSILVMDFDGVLCDSTEECVVTAWNAWQAWQAGQASDTGQFVREAKQVPEPFRSSLRTHRNYVRTAGEYLILIEAARTHRQIGSLAEYDRLFAEFRSKLSPYSDAFFNARDRLRRDDPSHWLNLHSIYTGIPEGLHRLWAAFECFVVTGKDRESVQTFFDRFDLPIETSRVYDKDVAHDKLSAIRMIAENLRKPLNSSIFLDDNIHHLLPPQEAGCRVFMAGWGYHTGEQIELAIRRSIPILQLEDWAGALLRQKVTA
jgi:phosphoglycolate phosphatase-like HAD superfamily hydrolase